MTPIELRIRAKAGVATMLVVPGSTPEPERPRGWTHLLVDDELREHASGEWGMRVFSRREEQVYTVNVRACSCFWWVNFCQRARLDAGDDGAGLCKHARLLELLLEELERGRLPASLRVVRQVPDSTGDRLARALGEVQGVFGP